MKIIKNIFYYAIILLSLYACERENTSPNEIEQGKNLSKVGKKVRLGGNLSESELKAKSAISVNHNGMAFYVGYKQASKNNQNPVAYCFDNGKLKWYVDNYEISGDDGSAYGILWNGGDKLYFVFSATGTQGEPEKDYRRFCTKGWLKSYGNGGGPKVSIIAKINILTGKAEAGTFLYAKNKNKTNSLQTKSLNFDNNGNIVVQADSWYSPLKINKEPFKCDGKSPFSYTVKFNPDLSKAISASTDRCK